MQIVFQNKQVVAADKRPGWLTVPGRQGAANPRPCLGRQLEKALSARLWPVHRLDFEVSGLVLFARNAGAHRVASAAFESRRVHKTYQALTEGAERVTDLPAVLEWQSRLVRGKRRSFEAPHGDPAHTRARAVARLPASVLAEAVGAPPAPGAAGPPELLYFLLDPETGRPHQLRVHLAKAGFPVAGDVLYGALTPPPAPDTIALRSVRLAFTDARDRAALGLSGPLEVSGLLPLRPEAGEQ